MRLSGLYFIHVISRYSERQQFHVLQGIEVACALNRLYEFTRQGLCRMMKSE